jgi:hypothetical protein
LGWDAIGAVAEILGAVAVFVTLVFLARQIKASNRLAESSAASELMNALGEVNNMMCEPSLAAALAKSKTNTHEFTAAEEVQLMHLCIRLCNVYMQAETSHRNGHLDDGNFAIVKSDVAAHLNAYPGNAGFFQTFLDSYPDASDLELVQGIERALSSRG